MVCVHVLEVAASSDNVNQSLLMHDNCKNYDRHNRKLIEQLKTHVLAPVITATDSIPATADYR